MPFRDLFTAPKPLIACIHLMPLPGSPRYAGTMREVYDTALAEAELFAQYSIDGLIIENFRDVPFYPHALPAETIAALTAVTREVVRVAQVPVGVNALRNDAQAALAIATAAEADFIRVLRAALRSHVLIFADVSVKHATPLVDRGLATEARDLTERGLVDAIIVSGDYTGAPTNPEDIAIVRQHTTLPILIGSGATPDNLPHVYAQVDGLIVGSYFKREGKAENLVEEARVKKFTDTLRALRHASCPQG
jgi:predicted TIM-barrel enzyme